MINDYRGPALCSAFIPKTEVTSAYSSGAGAFIHFGLAPVCWDMPNTTTGAFQSVSIPVSARTSWNEGDNPFQHKDFDRLFIYCRDYSSGSEPASATLEIYTNYSDTAVATHTVTPSDGYIDQVLGPGVSGKAISWKLSKTITDAVNDALWISGYAFSYTKDEVL
jgi:hypothetical protein